MAIKKKKENTRVEDKHDDLLSVLLSNNELNNQENNGLQVFLFLFFSFFLFFGEIGPD